MTIKVFSSFCWLAMLAAVPALSQISYEAPDSREAKTTSSSVAHVYVATPKGIELYNAASNGKLTLVSGSPFAGNLFDLVTNGKYLYGTDGTLIYEDSVGPNGALKQEATFNPGKYTGISGGGVIELDLDHTGATLYCNYYDTDDSTIYQSYSISKSNGDLTYLGTAGDNRFGTGPLSILGNNKFAFQTQYYLTYFMGGFDIGAKGALTGGIQESVFPTAQPGDGYNSYVITEDPTDHLAVAVYDQQEPPDGPIIGPTQLAVYTSDEHGNLTTTSTYENMPAVKLASVSAMSMSPSGKLLAVAGNGPSETGASGPTGLQVFHFNGPNPITKYTGLLTTTPIDEVRWDNANHLYALSHSKGKLYVFTVTPTSAVEAAGSPYTIAKPQSLIIRPL